MCLPRGGIPGPTVPQTRLQFPLRRPLPRVDPSVLKLSSPRGFLPARMVCLRVKIEHFSTLNGLFLLLYLLSTYICVHQACLAVRLHYILHLSSLSCWCLESSDHTEPMLAFHKDPQIESEIRAFVYFPLQGSSRQYRSTSTLFSLDTSHLFSLSDLGIFVTSHWLLLNPDAHLSWNPHRYLKGAPRRASQANCPVLLTLGSAPVAFINRLQMCNNFCRKKACSVRLLIAAQFNYMWKRGRECCERRSDLQAR